MASVALEVWSFVAVLGVLDKMRSSAVVAHEYGPAASQPRSAYLEAAEAAYRLPTGAKA